MIRKDIKKKTGAHLQEYALFDCCNFAQPEVGLKKFVAFLHKRVMPLVIL